MADLLAKYRAKIEESVRDQIRRHAKINPNFDLQHAVDIAIKQERQQLESLMERSEADDGDDVIEVMELLIKWLPQLANEIKSSYR